MAYVKKYQLKKIKKLVDDADPMANSKSFDSTKIIQILIIGYTLNSLKLAFQIM